jgi:hypothetical protein
MSNKHRVMISSLLSKCINVFILILIHFWSLVHSAHHQRSSIIPLMLIFPYWQRVSIALQWAQAIAIIQQAATLGWDSSSLTHIIASEPPSLARFVIDNNFLILNLLCHHWLSFRSLGSYLQKVFFSLIVCFSFFSLGCAYLWSHLPCTFNGQVHVLDFYIQGFFSQEIDNLNWNVPSMEWA